MSTYIILLPLSSSFISTPSKIQIWSTILHSWHPPLFTQFRYSYILTKSPSNPSNCHQIAEYLLLHFYFLRPPHSTICKQQICLSKIKQELPPLSHLPSKPPSSLLRSLAGDSISPTTTVANSLPHSIILNRHHQLLRRFSYTHN